MPGNITIGIERRFLRSDTTLDNSDPSIEFHNLRRDAIHDVLDAPTIVQVIDWGDTDDLHPHEYVEVVVSIISTALIHPIIIGGLQKFGKKLAEKAIDETTSEFVKWLISKLTKKQQDGKIKAFDIRLENGTRFDINIPKNTSEVKVLFTDGEVSAINYQLNK